MQHAPNNNSASSPSTREDMHRRLDDLRNRRHEIEMSDDRAATNGRLKKIDEQIRDARNQLAAMD